MNYESFTIELLGGTQQEYITVYLDEKNAKTFPADKSNADYVAFLAEIEKEETA